MPKHKRYLDNGGKPDSGFLDYIKSGVKAIANEVIGDKAARRRMISDLQEFGILPRGGENGQVHAVVAPGITDINEISPVHLAKNFIKNNKNKSKYIVDISEDMYGLNPNLQIVDYNAMNKYGKVFNKRIKKTLPLAKQRGTLRSNAEPNIVVADTEGRNILYNKFIEDTPILPNRKEIIHAGDPITNKGKLAKEYYYKTKPKESVFDSTPTSFADRKNNTIVLVPKNGNYKNMYKYTLPHEKAHMFIDAKREAELFGTDRGLKIKHRPGDIDIERDIYLSTPTEQLARGTQIKNYLGITDESPITAKQLKYASENYVKDTGYDNNMTDFFNMITDYNKAAKWLSNAPIVTPFLVGAAGYGMYRNNKRNGGRVSLRNGGKIKQNESISDSQYYNIMRKVANDNYKNWGFDNPTDAYNHAINDRTYDYRGYYNKYPNGKGNAIDHWTDEFKTVYHPTFSDESIYSGKVHSIFNPNGFTGGMWLNDIYIPPKYQSTSKLRFRNGGRLQFRGGGKKPITTGGAGYIPQVLVESPLQQVRKDIYRRINPTSDYNITKTLKGMSEGEFKYNVRNVPDFDYEKGYPRNTDYTAIRHVKAPLSVVDGIWAEYLQIPQKDRKVFKGPKIRQSNYIPSKGGNSNTKYYALPLTEGSKAMTIEEGTDLSIGENKVTDSLESYGNTVYNLGDYTIGRGIDKKGDYISYYDVFDLNPFSKKYNGTNIPILNKLRDASFGIGKPVHIYDRIYLDDYYGVKIPTHATYLPEVTVYGNRRKKSDGGSIHIAPSKRGTFTAAATRHGMGVQEFANTVLRNKDRYSPSLVKKANFARNASKWNH